MKMRKRKIMMYAAVSMLVTMSITSFSVAQVLDQSQTIINGTKFVGGISPEWQQFVPNGKNHEFFDLHIGCFFTGSGPLTMTIEKPLGTVILSTSMNANEVPNQKTDWTTFYVNGALEIGETYYIVLTAPLGSEYAWSYGNGDPYHEGVSSMGALQDFCFRTYVDRSKTKNSDDMLIGDTIYDGEFTFKNLKSNDFRTTPFGFIFAFGLDVDVKLVQLEPGEDYVDLEVLSKPLYIWENEIITINPGAFIRLYEAEGFFRPSSPFCFGMCSDWGIIG